MSTSAIEQEIASDLALTSLAKRDQALAEQIAQQRLDGRVRQAERDKVRREAEEAKAHAADERAEAQLRANLRRKWIAQGGRGADFEQRYDQIREAHFADLAERMAAGTTSPSNKVRL